MRRLIGMKYLRDKGDVGKMPAATDVEWLICPSPDERASVRLICFPHAGGGASFYSGWFHSFGNGVEVWSACLPGREKRIAEAPMDSLPALIDGLADALQGLSDKPIAFFGHSLGSLVAFELTRELRRRGMREPQHLFVSSFRAPHIPRLSGHFHTMSDDELILRLEQLNGARSGLRESEELRSLLLPALRADFKLSDTYRHATDRVIGCPITAFGGTEDLAVPLDQLRGWREHTSSYFQLRLFAGGHFYLRSAESEMKEIIGRELMASDDHYC